MSELIASRNAGRSSITATPPQTVTLPFPHHAGRAAQTARPESSLTVRDIAPLGAATEDEIARFVEGIALEFVPQAVLRARDARKALAAVERAAEQRLIEEGVSAWTDPESAEAYSMSAQGRWEIYDVEGFVAELAAEGVTLGQLATAITRGGFRLGVLEKIAREAVLEFRAWREGPRHLTKRE